MKFKIKNHKLQIITPVLILSRIFLKFFIIPLVMLSIVSCSGRDTIKSDPKHVSKMSTANKIGDKDTIKPKSTDANIFGVSSKNEQINESLLRETVNASHESDYILGPEDLIEIDVFQADELKRTVRISSSGFINLPLAGSINVSGLTVSQLEAEVSKKLEKYLQEPVVSVFIREYRSQRITVLGAVKNPQVFTVTHQKFLLDMLSAAGGITENAGDICYVQRGSETLVINIKELLLEGNARLNIPVYAGDIIHVPIGGIVFVNGAVNDPGSFALQGTVTLTQVIAMAKGLQFEAERKLRIYRDTGKEKREGIDVDYDEILEGKVQDIILKDKDVVIVPKNGAKTFLKGFVDTVKGFISFGKAL